MMTGPGDEVTAAAAGPGHLRASHADREQVIVSVKAAFVRGQLTTGELDARLGQALAARTHAELAAVTAGIPAGSDLAGPPKPARAPLRRPGSKPVNPGVWVITATTLAAGVWAAVAAGVAAAVIVAIFMLNLAALATRPLPRSRPAPCAVAGGAGAGRGQCSSHVEHLSRNGRSHRIRIKAGIRGAAGLAPAPAPPGRGAACASPAGRTGTGLAARAQE